MAALREGDRIHNYLLEARVGAGSFGEVWRARHHVFGEVVAIKVPTDPQYVRNLQREGVAIHGLRHPNIVRAIDMDPYADPPYLIMEYIDGPSLREVIEEQRNRFPIPAVLAIMRGTLNALGASHRNGVIHRDLKPANILLGHPRESISTIAEHMVKVADFGLGIVGGMTAQAMTQSGSISIEEGSEISGTLAYMSPEQKEGGTLDVRSDLYSCGIILFEMLTGERPQGTELPGSLRPDVPSYLDEIVRRSYTRLDRRYASAAEMLAAFVPASGPPPLPVRAMRNEQPRQRTGRVNDVAPSLKGDVADWALSGGVTPRCSDCDQPVHRDDQFCIGCGKQLVESVPRCSACQAYVHANDRFCIFCGKDMGILT